MDVTVERGSRLDPRDADLALASWVEEFLALARRLSPTTVQTYRRDLNKYVLTRFGSYRIGRLPADEIENWLNDEVAAGIGPSSVHRHYRTLRRVLQIALEKQKIPANPCDRVQPPHVSKREMTFLSWTRLWPWAGPSRSVQGPADMSGGRRGDALERTGRAPTGPARRADDAEPQGAGHGAAGPARDRRVAAQGAQDGGVGAVDHRLPVHHVDAGRPFAALRNCLLAAA
jgi:Phage integrase, N-terminal SAM-like domain